MASNTTKFNRIVKHLTNEVGTNVPHLIGANGAVPYILTLISPTCVQVGAPWWGTKTETLTLGPDDLIQEGWATIGRVKCDGRKQRSLLNAIWWVMFDK